MSTNGKQPFCYDFTHQVDRKVVSENSFYTTAELTYKNEVYRHFHYTSWPDLGVPTNLDSLIDMGIVIQLLFFITIFKLNMSICI